MRCSDELSRLGVRIVEVHSSNCEFICTGDPGVSSDDIAGILADLNFHDYGSPLSTVLRDPWWSVKLDIDDDLFFLVMGDPNQEV